MDKVVGTLRKALTEMERRYQIFSQLGIRNMDGYRVRREADPSMEHLPYLVIIIDELADLMMTTPDEVESVIVRLAQMARATGIHLIIATQRPSVDVLTGLIRPISRPASPSWLRRRSTAASSSTCPARSGCWQGRHAFPGPRCRQAGARAGHLGGRPRH